MKRLVLVYLLANTYAQAQKYQPYTTQKDDFSKAFIELLHCATKGFAGCKGDSLRSTWLMGDDYRLNISFPGSTIGVVRIRDWDKNAYVEFRGFRNEAETKKGLQKLLDIIKLALGNQFTSSATKVSSLSSFYSVGLKDDNGYFSPNIELFAGRSAANPYLLGPERDEEAKGEKQHFILLKIARGIPSYQYLIKEGVKPPDKNLHLALTQLIKQAKTDFDSLHQNFVFTKKKKTDTASLYGYPAILNYRSENYFAALQFFPGENEVEPQWNFLQRALQAALGVGYVYHLFRLQETDYVAYYASEYGANHPRIYLEKQMLNKKTVITVKVQSNASHPVKKGLSLNE